MKVMRSVVIDAPITEVWAVVRNFDGVVNWNAGVTAATLESGSPTQVGAVRKLDIADGSVFRETLLAHSDLEHFYTYNIIASPLPCRNYVSCHRFIEITDGDRTLGVWQGEFDCAEADAAELDAIVGDMIYLAAQQSLNQYLQEKK
ncbi:MAG: SRPBCC family protein [Gammaproteobacteria bacterium]|nr:SRPBCC family protein [Gammaproteobacteria bacterium]